MNKFAVYIKLIRVTFAELGCQSSFFSFLEFIYLWLSQIVQFFGHIFENAVILIPQSSWLGLELDFAILISEKSCNDGSRLVGFWLTKSMYSLKFELFAGVHNL